VCSGLGWAGLGWAGRGCGRVCSAAARKSGRRKVSPKAPAGGERAGLKLAALTAGAGPVDTHPGC